MGAKMINGLLTQQDILQHGPYKGWTVQDVLDTDPIELTAFTENGCEPLYNISPAVLRTAYEKAQDKLGWDEFTTLWDRSV